MIDFSPAAKLANTTPNGDYPETVYAGKAYPQYDRSINKDRLVISLKLYQASKDINLAREIKDGVLSFKAIKKKAADAYGNTHFLVVNQMPNGMWPKQGETDSNKLAKAVVDEYECIEFTLTQEQMVKYSYAYGEGEAAGTYMKLELIDNGDEQYIFRYFKVYKSPQISFMNAPSVAKAAAVPETADFKPKDFVAAPKTDDEFFGDL